MRNPPRSGRRGNDKATQHNLRFFGRGPAVRGVQERQDCGMRIIQIPWSVPFDRQKHLLALVDSLCGEMGSLDFQKLLFLYCREVQPAPSYEFVPYKYGGFSFTSYADKRRLVDQGFLADEERVWKLTPAG